MTTQSPTDLCYLSIREAASLLRRRELSPVELTQAYLERIDRVDKQVRAYITLLADGALSEARNAEAAIMRGEYQGPLHGIPIALKDLYDTSGVPTTAQSKVLADRVPDEDATAFARLKQAGTILLGKLAMSEFALGGGKPSLFTDRVPRNPWNLERSPAGSSSGSGAAVAAGLCMGALGSDTGGSVRNPATACGIVGLKPTYGRVSRFGVIPLSWSLDHCGPLTRTVEDTALMLQAMAGYDPKDPTTSGAAVPDYVAVLKESLQGVTVGLPTHFFARSPGVDAEYLAIVEQAVEVLTSLGALVKEVTIPSLEYVRAAHLVILQTEAFTYHSDNLRTRPHDYGENARMRFYQGVVYTAEDYVQAQRARSRVTREFSQVLQEVDVLVTPSAEKPAGPLESSDSLASIRGPKYSVSFNLTGLPALTVPCGFTAAGLPVGLQIAGRHFGEPTVLHVGHAYQQATRWFDRRPSL